MIKAIIFDCFGVLYPNASYLFIDRYKEQLKNGTLFLDELNLKIDLGEISRQDFFEGIEKNIHVSADKIRKEFDNDWVVDQNLVEFIKRLKNKYKIGLLSNGGEEELTIVFRDKIDSLFDSTTFSYDVRLVKPDEKIFQICLKKLNINPSEAILVEDSKTNIAAANKLGIQTIFYPKFGTIPHELVEIL